MISVMQCDLWDGRSNAPTSIDHPCWDDIKRAILSLDGTTNTTVVLSKKEDCYMTIGGQWDGLFIVNATQDNYDFFSAIDPEKGTETVVLFVGGQDGEYEKRKCVSKDIALQAARTFFEQGALDSALCWVSDY